MRSPPTGGPSCRSISSMTTEEAKLNRQHLGIRLNATQTDACGYLPNGLSTTVKKYPGSRPGTRSLQATGPCPYISTSARSSPSSRGQHQDMETAAVASAKEYSSFVFFSFNNQTALTKFLSLELESYKTVNNNMFSSALTQLYQRLIKIRSFFFSHRHNK